MTMTMMMMRLYLATVCSVGDLDSYREAVQRCEAQMKRVQERRAKVVVISHGML